MNNAKGNGNKGFEKNGGSETERERVREREESVKKEGKRMG